MSCFAWMKRASAVLMLEMLLVKEKGKGKNNISITNCYVYSSVCIKMKLGD